MLLLAVALAQTGCGTWGAYIGVDKEQTSRVAKVAVTSDPAGATVLEQTSEGFVERGTTPTSVTVGYKAKEGRSTGVLVGWGLGTAIDAYLGYKSLDYLRSREEGDSKLFAYTTVTAMALALMVDFIVLGATQEKAEPRDVNLMLQHPGYSDASQTISVPTTLEVNLALAKRGAVLSRDELRRRNIVRRDLGSYLVMELKAQGNLAKLGEVSTNFTATELQAYTTGAVTGKSDLEAAVRAEAMKDALGCNDVACYAELGGMVGADYVVSGVLTEVGSDLVIQLTVVNSRQAQRAGSVSRTVPIGGSTSEAVLIQELTRAIEELMSKVRDRK